MRKISSVPHLVLLSMLVFAASSAKAEMVEHHGKTIEAGGSPDRCIVCHDGLAAKNVSYCTVNCDFSTSHSILKKYPPEGKRASYAPVAAVRAKGIKFLHGKVTCISCHDLKKQNTFHLIMDEKGRLCEICHISDTGMASGPSRFEQGAPFPGADEPARLRKRTPSPRVPRVEGRPAEQRSETGSGGKP